MYMHIYIGQNINHYKRYYEKADIILDDYFGDLKKNRGDLNI